MYDTRNPEPPSGDLSRRTFVASSIVAGFAMAVQPVSAQTMIVTNSYLDSTLAWAGKESKGDVTRASITGFCWGGRVTWMYAAHNPSLKAGVAWYGRLTQGFQPGSRNPVDLAPALKVPVLGLYGGQDTGIPPADVEKMRAELAKGSSGSQIHVYPDAPHAFHADYRPSYRKEAAEDGWRRMLDWFKRQGVA